MFNEEELNSAQPIIKEKKIEIEDVKKEEGGENNEKFKLPVDEQEGRPLTRKKPSLSQHEEAKAREMIEEGNIEEFINILKENGMPASSQVELAMHYTRELQESIRLIAWNKKRLTYMTAILEHTLISENKKVTSSENLIQNYLIFNQIFQEGEQKLPRFGQFAYVMRGIFNGIETKDEIYERIANHKTFGEGITLNHAEIDALSKEIEKISTEIKQRFAVSQEKKRILDEQLKEAREDEEREKGTVWNASYSEPKEYFFPNYTFQTGLRKGLNHAPGRSSWEPMFLAYADVVNKNTADRIMSRTDISEEEKHKIIARQRIELLYEPFDFPIDIKESSGGTGRPVIYRLDFIDINRWRAIEVKGPLTPKGAEKIRLFKKYYVEGDFSDLPEEKKIIMMSYVEDKKSEIAKWCEERGYPVFDHFHSLHVLGAYKWDSDLNNFNRYADANKMDGLSARAKEQLQKGFFKLVEDRIAKGRTPDIRPEKYIETNQLKSVIKINELTAKAKGLAYEIESPISTKPYILSAIADDIFEAYKNQKLTDRTYLSRFAERSVLDTIPIISERRDVLVAIDLASRAFNNVQRDIQEAIKEKLSEDEFELVKKGKKVCLINITDLIDKNMFDAALDNLDFFRNYLLKLEKNKTIISSDQFKPNKITKHIKNIIEINRNRFIKSGNRFMIDKDYIDRMEKLNPEISLSSIAKFYKSYLLGDLEKLYKKRSYEINGAISDSLFKNPEIEAEIEEKLETIRKGLPFVKISNEQQLAVAVLIAQKTIIQEKVPRNLAAAFFAFHKITREFGFRLEGSKGLLYLIEEKFKNLEKAAKYFSIHARHRKSEAAYLEILSHLKPGTNETYPLIDYDQQSLREYLAVNEEALAAMAEVLLRESLGEEAFERLIRRFENNCKLYMGQDF